MRCRDCNHYKPFIHLRIGGICDIREYFSHQRPHYSWSKYKMGHHPCSVSTEELEIYGKSKVRKILVEMYKR